MHLYEYTVENHSKQRLPNESITVATPSNKSSPTVDPTHMPNQSDLESEPHAVLNQTGDSQSQTMILPNKTEYQNTHIYEHTIKVHLI